MSHLSETAVIWGGLQYGSFKKIFAYGSIVYYRTHEKKLSECFLPFDCNFNSFYSKIRRPNISSIFYRAYFLIPSHCFASQFKSISTLLKVVKILSRISTPWSQLFAWFEMRNLSYVTLFSQPLTDKLPQISCCLKLPVNVKKSLVSKSYCKEACTFLT